MGKKNKKEKDELENKNYKNDPNQTEDNDKVSIKKTFRDTGIIMALIAVVTGIVVFVNRDAFDPEYKSKQDNREQDSGEKQEANAEEAYKNLCSLANKQLIEHKNLNSNLEYVEGISSIEFAANQVVYCALGNKQDEYNYMVKITMSHNFVNADAFIYQMTNLNLNTAVTTYGVSTEVSDIYSSETINDKFDDKAPSALPRYDASKVFIHYAYKPTNSDVAYFSVTYAGDDGQLHSTNEMMYNDTSMDFTVASIYAISPSSSAKMYDLLGIILGLEEFEGGNGGQEGNNGGQEENNGGQEENSSQVAYKNLCSVANKELITTKNLNSSLEYVGGLSSIEFATNKVVYCALGNKQDEYNYLVKVTINYTFENENEFVHLMANLQLNDAVDTYNVSSQVYDIYVSEIINDKFDDKAPSTLSHYDTNKTFIHNAYKADGSDEAFVSVTYKGDNDLIYSINEMKYDNVTTDFTVVGDGYSISTSTSAQMYGLLGIILE